MYCSYFVVLISIVVYIARVDCLVLFFFFFKQKTAYEMRISDWSSDVCSSDLSLQPVKLKLRLRQRPEKSFMQWFSLQRMMMAVNCFVILMRVFRVSCR